MCCINLRVGCFIAIVLFVVFPGQDCFLTVLEGVPVPFPSPFFFRNPTSQCSNPIPTSRIWKKSQCYTYHLFSLRICKITASKYDPTKTQRFTRIYKDVLKITGSFQTVIKLSGREFIEEIHLIRIRNFGQHLHHLPPFLVASL